MVISKSKKHVPEHLKRFGRWIARTRIGRKVGSRFRPTKKEVNRLRKLQSSRALGTKEKIVRHALASAQIALNRIGVKDSRKRHSILKIVKAFAIKNYDYAPRRYAHQMNLSELFLQEDLNQLLGREDAEYFYSKFLNAYSKFSKEHEWPTHQGKPKKRPYVG